MNVSATLSRPAAVCPNTGLDIAVGVLGCLTVIAVSVLPSACRCPLHWWARTYSTPSHGGLPGGLLSSCGDPLSHGGPLTAAPSFGFAHHTVGPIPGILAGNVYDKFHYHMTNICFSLAHLLIRTNRKNSKLSLTVTRLSV